MAGTFSMATETATDGSQGNSGWHSGKSNRPSDSAGLKLALKFALRELRGGLSGFYIFLACIALGVGAIAGVNSVALSIGEGLSSQGKSILGGDISFSIIQRQLSEKENTFIHSLGKVSEQVTMRAMARAGSKAAGSKTGDDTSQTLIELKAADNAYPLFGKLKTSSGDFSMSGLGENEALVDPLLLDRLGLAIGDPIEIGSQSFRIKDTIASEPDRLSGGIDFGPKVIIDKSSLEKTGLVQPGSLIRYHYNVALDDNSDAQLEKILETAKTDFPDSGWRTRTRKNAAPALSNNIERFSQFLTLVGLTALIVGGVGIANATRAYLETKRSVIASFKALGAPGGFIFNVYFFQILLLAGVGIAIGLAIGALMPVVAKLALANLVPVSNGFSLYPGALATGALFGVLTASAFSILPLGSARETAATTLFRSDGYDSKIWPRYQYLLLLVVLVALLATLAIMTSDNRKISIVFVCAIAVSFVLLRIVAFAIQWLARKAPRVRSTSLRMAIGNIHRPGSLTPSVVLSLGLGLALLVALSTIDGNLRQQVSGNLSEQAPDFFFVDIQNTEIDGFKDKLQSMVPDGKIISVPMLRGRITELKGIDAQDYKTSEGAWVLRGDRGITYAKNMPENSTLASGEWWPADYSGKPLVSFSEEEANELGLKVGDVIKVNVLGRTIESRIANLRRVEWETLGINFVMVFSPNTFAGAPHTWLATLSAPKGTQTISDGTLLKTVAQAWPSITSVRVKDALDIVNRLIGQLATAIRAAASVALIASVLVLGGALAAGNRSRVHDAVVLKTLGAKRMTLIGTYVCEYALLGLITAIFGLFSGTIAAWFVISTIMQFQFIFLPWVALATVVTALVLTVGFGLVGTWRVLGHKSAPVLREL